MTSLRSLIDRASGYAEALFDPADCLTPHFVAEDAGGELTIACLHLGGGDLDRVRADFELKFTLERYHRWVFFSEAWHVEYAEGERRRGEPKDDPRRIEVVVFDGYDVAGRRRRRASRQILRLPEGDRLMPLVWSELPVRWAPSTVVPSRPEAR